MFKGQLLSSQNAETIKGESLGYATLVFYGSPAKTSGFNSCANSGLCADICIYYQGMGRFKNVKNARIRKTRLYFEDRPAFLDLMRIDIEKAIKWAYKKNLTPVFRLDGTTDIGIARKLAKEFPHVRFYDYTKIYRRIMQNAHDNWHLTYSLSEKTTDAQLRTLLGSRHNIAVPIVNVPSFSKPITFKLSNLNSKFVDRSSVNGDQNDLRFLDGKGKIVFLKVKGKEAREGFTFKNIDRLNKRLRMVV